MPTRRRCNAPLWFGAIYLTAQAGAVVGPKSNFDEIVTVATSGYTLVPMDLSAEPKISEGTR